MAKFALSRDVAKLSSSWKQIRVGGEVVRVLSVK